MGRPDQPQTSQVPRAMITWIGLLDRTVFPRNGGAAMHDTIRIGQRITRFAAERRPWVARGDNQVTTPGTVRHQRIPVSPAAAAAGFLSELLIAAQKMPLIRRRSLRIRAPAGRPRDIRSAGVNRGDQLIGRRHGHGRWSREGMELRSPLRGLVIGAWTGSRGFTPGYQRSALRAYIAVSVHGPGGDWSIFRRIRASITNQAGPKTWTDPLLFPACDRFSPNL